MTGHKIAMLRTQANLTQEQLAEKLYITRELVSKWETGKRNPDYKTIVKLAEIFSVDTDEIINHNEFLFSELSEFLPDISNYKSEKIKVLLNSFLETLNIRDRSVFIRRYYFSEEISDIAKEYNIKESNVRTILMRTRKKLKKYFQEVEIWRKMTYTMLFQV